jgi:hypothetical protein
MATAQGNRGAVSRLGGKDSGVETHAAGWSCGVRVWSHGETDGSEEFRIYMTGGSMGAINSVLIGRVVLDKEGRRSFIPEPSKP